MPTWMTLLIFAVVVVGATVFLVKGARAGRLPAGLQRFVEMTGVVESADEAAPTDDRARPRTKGSDAAGTGAKRSGAPRSGVQGQVAGTARRAAASASAAVSAARGAAHRDGSDKPSAPASHRATGTRAAETPAAGAKPAGQRSAASRAGSPDRTEPAAARPARTPGRPGRPAAGDDTPTTTTRETPAVRVEAVEVEAPVTPGHGRREAFAAVRPAAAEPVVEETPAVEEQVEAAYAEVVIDDAPVTEATFDAPAAEPHVAAATPADDVDPSFEADPAPVDAPAEDPAVVTVMPARYADARDFAEPLSAGALVVLDLQRLPVAERRRVLDFATGVVFGLGGRLQRVDALRFVGVPEHVDIPASRLPSLVDATADVA